MARTGGQKVRKGLPKRTGKKKSGTGNGYSAACHARTEERKKTRRARNAARHTANEELRALGVPTPWETAGKARAERREKERISGHVRQGRSAAEA